jgi:hypothetical protein
MEAGPSSASPALGGLGQAPAAGAPRRLAPRPHLRAEAADAVLAPPPGPTCTLKPRMQCLPRLRSSRWQGFAGWKG